MSAIRNAWLRRCASAAGIIACWLLFTPLHAGAAPLDISDALPDGTGDMSTFYINVNYDHTSGVLTATGTTDGNLTQLYEDGVSAFQDPLLNVFTVTANLNPANGALISGTVDIEGNDPYACAGFTTAY